MILRPNQSYALAEIERLVAAGARRICVTSPTGGGKSLVMMRQIENGRRSALYTDRTMLMSQLEQDLLNHSIPYGVRAAGRKPALLEDVQLCMVQTESSRCLKRGREIHAAKQVLIDEAHKNAGESMETLWAKHTEANADAVKIGFTATPLGIGHAYDELVVAGTVSELRAMGALVPAYVYGPDEPDTKWVGKIAVGEGECGLPNAKRMEFAHRVFGRVVENYRTLNPDRMPTILFAPGVPESKWFAETLCNEGISAAHIDGSNVWLDGEEHDKSPDLVEEIARRSKSGDIEIVCNRFVLREGINWPWICHGIFATVFGSLTSYIQAGGRLLRAADGKDRATVQDHGGNWWRHGSLNADREWSLEYTDRIMAGMREQRLRDKKEPEPIVCAKCHAIRLSGSSCHSCGHRHEGKSRVVVQADGSLREMKGDIFRKRRELPRSEFIQQEWSSRVSAVRRSKKPTVQNMTYCQLATTFARDHNWAYPPHTLKDMPRRECDWFLPIKSVPQEALT